MSSTNITAKLKHGHNTNDVFLVVLEPDFSAFKYTIQFGGAGHDDAEGMAVAGDGHAVYFVGSTTSPTNFVTPNAAQPLFGGNGKNNRLSDAFVGKIEIAPGP